MAKEKQIDIKKVVRQHAEMDMFFTGGFGLKSESDQNAQEDTELPETTKATSAQAAKGLKEITGDVNMCCRCSLSSSRTNAVPGEGSPSARIVFVGEAPGADEDARGRPFVGKAGKLLDKIINAMGLKRGDVFICNILKCRPPDNRDPRPDEIVKCQPFLHKQLEAIGPEIIVALGAHAAQTLLETDKTIGKLRGMFHEYYTSQDSSPIKLMATYHPAYLLRSYSPENRKKVWDDMKKVLTELGMEIPSAQSK